MTAKLLYQPDKLIDQLLDAVCVVDSEGRFVYLSAACERLFGYTREELIGKNMIDLVDPQDRERTLQAAQDIMNGQPRTNFENRYIRKDGSTVHIMWSARWSETDRVRLAVARDITEYKRNTYTKNALYQILEAVYAANDIFTLYQQIHNIISSLIPAENIAIILYDPLDGMLSFPYFIDKREQNPGPHALKPGTPVAMVIQHRQSLLANIKNLESIAELKPAGKTHHFNWLGVPLVSQNKVMGALIVWNYSGSTSYTEADKQLLDSVSTQVSDAIQHKQTEIRLRHLADHDVLTNLPNRTLFQDRFDMALKRARREKEHVALLYLDLNNFKHINDTYGHETGDKVLCEVAHRLTQCVREADTIGRRGGDEFTILLTNIRGVDIVDTIVAKIHSSINLPFQVDGRTHRISASIGTAVYPEQGTKSEHLFHHADTNMYVFKRNIGKTSR